MAHALCDHDWPSQSVRRDVARSRLALGRGLGVAGSALQLPRLFRRCGVKLGQTSSPLSVGVVKIRGCVGWRHAIPMLWSGKDLMYVIPPYLTQELSEDMLKVAPVCQHQLACHDSYVGGVTLPL